MKVGEVLRMLDRDEKHPQAGWPPVRIYALRLVIEKAEGNYSAYVPDLPGCVATGATVAEVEAELREAIAFHVEGLQEDGLPVPASSSQVDYIEVPASERPVAERLTQPAASPAPRPRRTRP